MIEFSGDWETDLMLIEAMRIIDGLDPLDRLIYALNKMERYKCHEIAAMSGLKTNCVQKRMQRVKQQIIQKK